MQTDYFAELEQLIRNNSLVLNSFVQLYYMGTPYTASNKLRENNVANPTTQYSGALLAYAGTIQHTRNPQEVADAIKFVESSFLVVSRDHSPINRIAHNIRSLLADVHGSIRTNCRTPSEFDQMAATLDAKIVSIRDSFDMYKAAVEESKTSGADVLPDFAKTALKEILTFSQISISETDLTMLAKDVVIVTKVGANDAEPMTVRMGDFKIAINSSNLRNYCADNSQTPPIRVAAAGNNSNVDGYTHPHVEHGTGYCTPCFGEAQYILKNYIPAGYLSDAFQVMVQFLQTYGGSPFKHIQFFVPGHTVCRSCKSLVKSETTVECSVDGKMYCQACIGKDEVTGQVVAKHRLTSCDGCGKLGISSATSIRVNSYDKRKYCPECNAKVVVPPVEYIGADFVLKPGKCNCGCEYSEPVIVTDNVTGMISCTACGDVDAMVIKSFIDDKNAFNFWVNKFLREVDITDYQFSIPDSADDRKAVITCLNYIYQAVMAEEEAVPNKHIIARIHQTFYECGVCEKGVEFFTVKA